MKNFQDHLITSSSTLREGLIAINQISDGILCLFVLDEKGRLVGTLTDGDIRRALISGIVLSDKIESAMMKNYEKIKDYEITPSRIRMLREKGIKLLPFIDETGRINRVYNLVEKKSLLPFDAVLMAGGKGIRLRPMTEKTPKPLLRIGEKSIIDINIDRLINFGIEHIHVTVNYLAEQIEDHFSKDRRGIRIECVKEPEYLGTIGSIKFIPEFYHDSIMVMNSDLFTNIDFEDFYDFFLKNDADMAVAAVPYSVSIPYGIFDLDENNIKGLNEKPTYDFYANGGIYLIKKKLINLIPPEVFFDATDFIELLIQKGFKVVKFPIIGYWIDIGKPEDYRKVQEIAKHIKF